MFEEDFPQLLNMMKYHWTNFLIEAVKKSKRIINADEIFITNNSTERKYFDSVLVEFFETRHYKSKNLFDLYCNSSRHLSVMHKLHSRLCKSTMHLIYILSCIDICMRELNLSSGPNLICPKENAPKVLIKRLSLRQTQLLEIAT